MNSLLLVIAITIAVRSFAASRLDRWNLGAPVVIVAAGVVIGPVNEQSIKIALNTQAMLSRVRSVLNVESGYNDGIISPLFLFALILAGDDTQERTPLSALATVLPFALKALIAGLLLGTALALLLTCTATVAVDGNGFVASFVGGIGDGAGLRVPLAVRVQGQVPADLPADVHGLPGLRCAAPHRERGQPRLPAPHHPAARLPPRRQDDQSLLTGHSGPTWSGRQVRPTGGVRPET
jgi:hypothetical protein